MNLVGTHRLSLEAVTPSMAKDLGAAIRQLARDPRTRAVFEGRSVPADVCRSVVAASMLRCLERCGVLHEDDGLTSAFRVHEVETFLVLTDPDVPDEHQAPTYLDPLWEAPALIRVLVRGRVKRALDVGVGCGVLSLALSRYAETVVGTDVNPRACEVARFNAALNGVTRLRVELGDLFVPVSGEQFDRILFNSPTDLEERQLSLLASGEGILARFFEALVPRLTATGYGQVNLAMNDYTGAPFRARLGEWLGDEARHLQLLLLVLEAKQLTADRLWKRGWLTCRRGAPFWLEWPCAYNALPHAVTSTMASRLIRALMDAEQGRARSSDGGL